MSDGPVTSFSLVREPWILAQRHDGTVSELSLLDVFAQASELRRIVGELPTQSFAIVRLLLAILYRATEEPIDRDRWASHWRDHSLPVDEITAYLGDWEDRFDLLHPTTPFYQVADLHTQKGEFTELARLIGDAPVGYPFLTTRVGVGLESLSFAEASRWLVHCQAYDVSGIKSGAVGDPRVKGGKGYPIGVGASGQIGGILLAGSDLLETLLLNLVPVDGLAEVGHGVDDFATWEAEPYGPAPLHEKDGADSYRPGGIAEVLTWQTRRIRLVNDGTRVREVLISNGDRFSPVNLRGVELMTRWRLSVPQAKKLGLAEAYMPRSHDPSRSLWRGLESLLATDEASSVQVPATVRWAGVAAEQYLPAGYVAHAAAFGIDYVNQASVVGDVVDDEIAMPVRALREDHLDLRLAVTEAVRRAEEAVRAYSGFVANLERAAGGDGTGRDKASDEGYAALDPRFRQWILTLRRPEVTSLAASAVWASVARAILLDLGEQAVDAAGPASWVGRTVDGRHLDAPLAEKWFRSSLYKIFPFVDESES